MKKVLSIAGFDTSGGAGLQADITTICSLNAHALSVATSITSQNSFGVYRKEDIKPKNLKSQIKTLKKDIDIDAIKIGMLSSKKNINIVSRFVANLKIPIVLDTVMISSSGFELLDKDAIKSLKYKLIPKCTLITPNILEAETLSNLKIKDINDIKKAAKKINKTLSPKAILIKGGHLEGEYAIDLLYYKGKYTIFKTKKINKTASIHGTGCVLSSAIATFLSKGYSLKKSIKKAKRYITKAIKKSYKIGKSDTRYLQNRIKI